MFHIGTYLYTEGNEQDPGDKARIESFANNPTDGMCVEFWYFMYGKDIGSLHLLIRRGEYVDPNPLWSETGDQGSVWRRAFVTVIEDSKIWKVRSLNV